MRTLLWIRALGGWGEHPNELRADRDVVWRALPLLLFVLMAACAFIPADIFVGDESHHRPTSLSQVVSESVPIIVLFIVIELLVILRAVWWGLLARHGDRMSMASVYGRCFKALSGPPKYLFARIGLTSETARWYALPLDWDEVVEPGDAEYELTVNPGTGWVERLRRLGASPREVVQEVPVILTGEAARAKAEDDSQALLDHQRGDVTKEERQAFKRFAHVQRPEWRADGWTFAISGWAGIIGGVVIGAGWSAFVLFLFIRFPHAFHHPSDYEAPDISMIVAAAIGLALVLVGHYYFRIWWRIRPFRHLEPVSTVGEVVAWMPYRDLYSPTDTNHIKETLIELRRADGTSHIFRIPVKYAHRVRERGQMVRVFFRPTTERVVTVQRLERTSPPAPASE